MVTQRNNLTEDVSFMDEYVGDGFEAMDASNTAIAYLGLVQPDSSVIDDDNKPGTWRNSATGRNYGNNVEVIALAFRTIWSEREATPPFRTVGRYAPNSIEVEIKTPPKGKRGYPKMVNPETGNEIQELYVYAVILPDFLEDGVLYMSPTVSSMRTCKGWNSQLKGQILPNGAQAPIFGYRWVLTAELVPNPQQPSKNIAVFSKVTKSVIVDKELFVTSVQPQLSITKQAVLQITEDDSALESEQAQ